MSVRYSAPLVPSPPGRADPRPVSSDRADARFTSAAWMGEPTEAKPIHTSTCHVDLSSTPGVCASPGSLNVPSEL